MGQQLKTSLSCAIMDSCVIFPSCPGISEEAKADEKVTKGKVVIGLYDYKPNPQLKGGFEELAMHKGIPASIEESIDGVGIALMV